MVLIRARRSKLASTVRQGDSEDGPSAQRQAQVRVRQENRRRAVLYDVSSPSGKRLPSVCLQPADARARRDLMRITQMEDKRMESEKKSAYEAEQNDSKHREHLNYRPPMDHIQNLHDLHTTVAKDCRGRVKLTPEQRMFAKLKQKFGSKQYGEVPDGTKPEWRLGYKNNIDTGSHAGVNGTFEPRDGTRERILDSRNFRSVVDVECRKRQRDRDAILQKLSTRGLLHSIPLAQIFARLRREGLLNIDRRLQRSIFERMTLDEYMSACGCLNANMTPPLTASDRKQPDSPIKEIKRFSTNLINTELMAASSVDASPSLLATRNALAVSRQQFHLALEAFNLSPTDVNWFFSALDVTVSDRVQVWDAMCSVETLQHEHTALRRARVQQLQAPPSKDLEFFRRQSIT
ncbi:hypothetical protein PF010_g14034 [Phytophthora fragariae]|uniref:Uncharacterized protein n=1 Tax=Phytophthora fragariae TaxID=53985 RepID=A0A6G0KY43_9STRA|nr:hypothetical protein PF010_g14034 [Phytophthora fragariae]